MRNDPKDRVNDFVIKIANVNGTGSASANALLLKSIFEMGVPVVGKNFFPSNIQGLPTWYEIRVTREAHKARSGRVDMMVAKGHDHLYATGPPLFHPDEPNGIEAGDLSY